MQLAELVRVGRAVAATASRLEKVALLADLLRALAREEVETAVAFLGGEPRQGKLGVGWKMAREALGAPAAEPTLALLEVDRAFEALAGLSGKGSAAARRERLGALFARATADEQDFLLRLLQGELRQGALEGVLVEAVAAAAGMPAERVRRAAMLGGALRAVAVEALAGGDLERFRLELLRPVQPMLAQSAASVAEALERLERAALEWKLDGARVQVHRADDAVRVFSRAGNDVTAAVPEVVEAARALPARALVLEGEAIALAADGRPQPFQVTMRRFGRRLDVEALRAELPLSPFFFDLLHEDGVDWLERPYAERRARLAALVPAPMLVPAAAVADAAAGEAFLADALARGHEGVMAKDERAPYEAGRRGAAWLKVKPARTLDLVVLAAEEGSGRRRGWLSNLHLGARDPRTGGFVMVGKTFKGMTDETLAWQTERLGALATAREGHVVFVRPELVVEIALDGVQASPHYPGGAALRFARLRGYRPDKRPEDADTIDAVRALGGLGER